ncbi:UDP-N-acetylglucosamine 1-carboxyvinyltransferase [Caldicellulosiruptor owensensis OL]|uniref:UDP-N-acetylglucosamine 1-carboxyvinyltransferase n=1 Tax=Caldicellulosiruptor owensensis (strain ATCC 700167 / DSM 13100 / OL) TaxID=632518 RepID=E4Q533_CALOW|nr:UDP-N-acetylglucosamine 1-carboxyvinyltransferase [Caldicellulosiruptor owensensis]ADQ04200.1 UDP-N-acetylglucosamine 1-carboxyvinyltransferase [Caldicellulosiruptor owensensis OL]
MQKLIIYGPAKLMGEIEVEGAKNAVLPILTASILAENKVIITNVPDIADVKHTLEILKYLGCKVLFENNTVVVDSRSIKKFVIPPEYTKLMRSSILFMGALLSKFKKVELSNQTGGCEIGQRPIDLHILAFRHLGIDVSEYDSRIICKCEKIKSGEIFLPIPSVGATENIILASIFCDDKIVIKNAAKEPEIADLCHFLNKLGAKIKGAGTHIIKIEGVKKLKNEEVVHRVIPDRIVAGTYLCAVAACGEEVVLRGVFPRHLDSILHILKSAGCKIKESKNEIWIKKEGRLKGGQRITTHYYPGFPTDLQAPVCSAFVVADGVTIIKETIFENRFKHIPELIKMGADIHVEKDIAVINGVEKLRGCRVFARDLRGGAALFVAGLCAEGVTEVFEAEYIDRGYEKIEEKYSCLGAKIIREKGE